MQQKNNTNLIHILKGSLIGVALLLSTITISTLAIYKANLSDKTYIPFLTLSIILSGILSGYISTFKIRKNGLVNGAVAALPLAVILLVSMSVANNAFALLMLIPCAIMVVSGAIGGIAAVNIKRKTKKK